MKFEKQLEKTKKSTFNALARVCDVLGFERLPDGTFRPKEHEPSYKTCEHCGFDKAYVKEIHPDTYMNEIVTFCPDCGHEKP